MKKLINMVLSLALFFLTISNCQTATAATREATPSENGCYWEIIIQDAPSSPAVMTASTTKTITKTKTAYCKNENGTVLWSVAITGTFSYDGSTSKCTSCTHKATATATAWYIKSSSSSRSGNSATATAIATHQNGILAKDYSKSVTIKCSKDGIVS